MKTIYFLLLVSLVSCFQKNNPENDSIKMDTKIKNFPVKGFSIDLQDSVLHSIVKENFFSSNQKKDTFKLKLYGDSIYTGKVDFIIIDYRGQEIYKETFPSSYLIGYGLIGNSTPSVEDSENYIIKRMNSFFDDKEFSSPAIKPDIHYMEDNEEIISREDWGKIKRDKNSIGFTYYIAEESISSIVFSHEKRKVVVYYVCC